MKVSTWLKNKKIYRYRKRLIVTVNGLRIPAKDYLTEEFNSRKDAIYCVITSGERKNIHGVACCYNKAYIEMYKIVNCK